MFQSDFIARIHFKGLAIPDAAFLLGFSVWGTENLAILNTIRHVSNTPSYNVSHVIFFLYVFHIVLIYVFCGLCADISKLDDYFNLIQNPGYYQKLHPF